MSCRHTFRRFNRRIHIEVYLLHVRIFLEQQCLTLLILQGKELFDQQVARIEDAFIRPISGTDVKGTHSKEVIQVCYDMTLKQII